MRFFIVDLSFLFMCTKGWEVDGGERLHGRRDHHMATIATEYGVPPHTRLCTTEDVGFYVIMLLHLRVHGIRITLLRG